MTSQWLMPLTSPVYTFISRYFIIQISPWWEIPSLDIMRLSMWRLGEVFPKGIPGDFWQRRFWLSTIPTYTINVNIRNLYHDMYYPFLTSKLYQTLLSQIGLSDSWYGVSYPCQIPGMVHDTLVRILVWCMIPLSESWYGASYPCQISGMVHHTPVRFLV